MTSEEILENLIKDLHKAIAHSQPDNLVAEIHRCIGRSRIAKKNYNKIRLDMEITKALKIHQSLKEAFSRLTARVDLPLDISIHN